MAENCCRLCLQEDLKSKILIDDLIAMKIRNACEIEMDIQVRKLPKNVCKVCYDMVNNITEFKYKCQANDRYLRNIFYPNTSENESDIFVYEDVPIKIEAEDCDSSIKPVQVVENFVKFTPISITPKKIAEEDNKRNSNKIGVKNESLIIKKKKLLIAKEGQQSFVCNICKSIFKRKDRVTKHLLIHENIDVKCEKCKQLFVSIDSFKEHLNIKHNRCKKNDSVEKNVRQKKTLRCKSCNLDNISSEEFKKHQSFHELKVFICDYCGITRKKRWNLIQHIAINHLSKDTARQCHICGIISKNCEGIGKHLRYHLKKYRVKCEICGVDINKSNLKQHLVTHSEEKKIECNICHMKFKTKLAIRYHLIKHSGIKNCKCKYCGMKFANGKTLRDHEKLHTGEKSHYCPECNKGFIQLSNMKSHFRNNHKDVKFVYKNKRQLKRESWSGI